MNIKEICKEITREADETIKDHRELAKTADKLLDTDPVKKESLYQVTAGSSTYLIRGFSDSYFSDFQRKIEIFTGKPLSIMGIRDLTFENVLIFSPREKNKTISYPVLNLKV